MRAQLCPEMNTSHSHSDRMSPGNVRATQRPEREKQGRVMDGVAISILCDTAAQLAAARSDYTLTLCRMQNTQRQSPKKDLSSQKPCRRTAEERGKNGNVETAAEEKKQDFSDKVL